MTKITDQNNVLYRQMLVNNLDRRHDALRLEEIQIRESLKRNEVAKLELNRYMNRAGQLVDKLA